VISGSRRKKIMNGTVCPPITAITLALASAIAGSTGTRAQTRPKPPSAKAPAPAAASDEEKQRRETARFLLASLADEAAKFSDLRLRVRVQARVADTLWTPDRERATALFRKAWDSAELARAEELRAASQRGPAEGATVSFDEDVRFEVLKIVTRRDRALGEQFLARLAEARAREDEQAAAAARSAPHELEAPPDAVAQRLRLAADLLSGDPAKALEIAAPALASVTVPGVEFLTDLREKDAAGADAQYAAMLARAAADPGADALTVSVLGSYIYSPHTYVLPTSTMIMGGGARPPVSDELRAAFFRSAAQVLLRPLAPEQLDQTRAGRVGTFLVLARLLPLAEVDAPDVAVQFQAKMTTLGVENADELQAANRNFLRQGLDENPEHSFGSSGSLADAIARAGGAAKGEKRDDAYARAATVAVGSNDPRARELADAIDDGDLRAKVRTYVDFVGVQAALGRKDADETVRLVRSSVLPSYQKAWALCAAARMIAKADHERAREILEEGADAARHADLDDVERTRALFAVATSWIDVDERRVSEATTEAVRSANRTPAFTGQDGGISIVLNTRQSHAAMGIDASEFNVDKPFVYLAGVDVTGATAIAKSFTAETPRAAAILTVGQTVLAEKGSAAHRSEP
jgi:hypothetical protein